MARGAYISREIVEGILMLHKVNPDLKYTKIAEVYPVDASTAGKIVACGSWEGYCRFKDEKAAKQRERKAKQAARESINMMFPMKVESVEESENGVRIVAKPKQMELQGGVDYQVQVNEQLAGQMKMDLPEEKTEMSDKVKMMRFLAGRFETLETSQNMNMVMINRNLEKICDYMSQILRVIGPESGK